MAPQVSGIDSNDQDGQHHGGLWVLAVALVAFAGLAAALAIEVFDGSSSNDAVTTVYVDPRLDSDFHRTPGQLSPKDPIPVECDNDDYLRVSGQLSPKDPIPVECDNDDYLRISGRLSPEDLSTPAIDKDFQREANQAPRRKMVRAVRIRAARTRPTDPPGSTARPAERVQAATDPLTAPPVRSAGLLARDPRCSSPPRASQLRVHVHAAATGPGAVGARRCTAGDVRERGVRSANCRDGHVRG